MFKNQTIGESHPKRKYSEGNLVNFVHTCYTSSEKVTDILLME